MTWVLFLFGVVKGKKIAYCSTNSITLESLPYLLGDSGTRLLSIGIIVNLQ